MSVDDSAIQHFSEKGYAYVQDFLPPEVTEIAYRYGMLRFKLGHGKSPEGDSAKHGAREQYGDSLMETILDWATPKMEKLVGRELWPTYSYYRLYQKGMTFPRHWDRPSCEFSASICLGRDFSNLNGEQDWPLYANGTPVPCPPGGGVIYKGCEVEHWRDPLEGNHQLQVFLHFVDKHGVWGQVCRYDSRPMLGVPAKFRHPDKVQELERLEAEHHPRNRD